MDVKYVGDFYKVSLLHGKVYPVVSVENGYYRIFDEEDEDYLYAPGQFEVVSTEPVPPSFTV